jgi:predicted nucleic acid-binding protein
MIEYVIDTNVFLRIFKGDRDVAKFIGNLEIAIDTTVYIECIQGSKSNLEKRKIKQVLDNLPLLHITATISQTTINLIDTYSNSHGLLLADALIAASALENDLTVVTYDIGDFKFISGLKYLEPTI